MHRPLATDKARYQGDGVAIVIAETRAQAKDAAELVEVDYDPLPAVIDPEKALEDGAPIIHDEFGTNHCYTWKLTSEGADAVFDSAPVTVKERYRQQRLIPNAIEPRGVIGQYMQAQDEYTLWSATQIPHIARFWLAIVLGIPEARLRVIAPDVGGGFGSKLNVYAEEALALSLAKRVGRPVKWTEERSEAYLATIHGRDHWQEIELAATEDGTIKGIRAKLIVGLGAYLQLVTAGTPILGGWVYGGAYDIDAYDLEVIGAFTTATPTDAYRGAGRPEATYLVERGMDAVARKLDMDPVEVRRKSFISEFPKTLKSGLEIDSGDFEGALDRALEMADYEALRKEQAERRARGDTKELGIGFSTYTEMCGLAPSRILGAILYAAGGWDAATVRCLPTGSVEVFIGTSPHGQGHVTTFSQIVAERLGVPIDQVEVIHGDTTVMQLGLDTYGSRSLAVGGIALYNAAEKVIDKARAVVAHKLEVSADDLEYETGTFKVAGTDRSMTVRDAALHAFTAHDLPDGMEPGLEATFVYDPPNFSWPGGAHICIVEVDTETGEVDLRRYIAVDEVGNVINPMVVDGQVHGGVTQGIAQALWEEADLRRRRQPDDGVDDHLPRPQRGRDDRLRARPRQRAEPDEPARRQGRGGDGDDRLDAGGHQRDRRRALAVRRHRRRDARQAGTGLASDPGRERRCDVIPAKFDYERAESVDHALELLGSGPDAKLLAGGHSLLPLMKLRFARPELLVDIGRLADLSYVREDGDRDRDRRAHPLPRPRARRAPAGAVRDPRADGRGGRRPAGAPSGHDRRLGGPRRPGLRHADGAARSRRRARRSRPDGERTVAAGEFFRGFFETALEPQEILTEIRVPKARRDVRQVQPPGPGLGDGRRRGGPYERGRTDRAHEHGPDAAARDGRSRRRSASGSDPAAAAERAAEGTSPPSDHNASAEFRGHVVKVLVAPRPRGGARPVAGNVLGLAAAAASPSWSCSTRRGCSRPTLPLRPAARPQVRSRRSARARTRCLRCPWRGRTSPSPAPAPCLRPCRRAPRPAGAPRRCPRR